MQGSLFQHVGGQSAERFRLENAQVLAVRLGADAPPEVFVTGYEQQTYGATGEQLNLMRCYGNGTVYLAYRAQYLCVVDVDHDGLIVDGEYILAFDPHLAWNVVAIDSRQAIAAAGMYNLDMRGQGKIALMTSGKPLVLRVDARNEAFVDADAVVAWTAGLGTRMEAQTVSSRVWRRRGGTGEGWNMCFIGEGCVVVQPREPADPDEYAARGLPYGMGSSGYRGSQWGSRPGHRVTARPPP
ncbi:AIM24 family protein [Yinghuangia aomiensis]